VARGEYPQPGSVTEALCLLADRHQRELLYATSAAVIIGTAGGEEAKPSNGLALLKDAFFRQEAESERKKMAAELKHVISTIDHIRFRPINPEALLDDVPTSQRLRSP
jgi:hypothetical protein